MKVTLGMCRAGAVALAALALVSVERPAVAGQETPPPPVGQPPHR